MTSHSFTQVFGFFVSPLVIVKKWVMDFSPFHVFVVKLCDIAHFFTYGTCICTFHMALCLYMCLSRKKFNRNFSWPENKEDESELYFLTHCYGLFLHRPWIILGITNLPGVQVLMTITTLLLILENKFL